MSKNALRFSSPHHMPDGMRKLYEATVRGSAQSQADSGAIGGTKKGRTRKYGNETTTVDGIRFDSKREARYYEHLKLRKASGEVSHWLRQVPIHLPCGTRYVLDFLVFFADPVRAPEYVDVKGRETKEFRIKKRGVEHHYPIRILLA